MSQEHLTEEEFKQVKIILEKLLRLAAPSKMLEKSWQRRTGRFGVRVDIDWAGAPKHDPIAALSFETQAMRHLERNIREATSDGRRYRIRIGEIHREDTCYSIEALVLLMRAADAEIGEYIIPEVYTPPLDSTEKSFEQMYVNYNGQIEEATIARHTVFVRPWGDVFCWKRIA